MLPSVRLLQPDDRAQQNRLAGAGAADHAQNLPTQHIKIDVVVQNVAAEPGHQPADPDGRSGVAHIPSTENRIEKTASATMTRKIDSTTACVVSLPTLDALRSTCNPW